jgi:putative transposase
MERRTYPTDLTDKEWALLAPLIPPAKRGGRPRTTDMRAVLNAIFYLLRSGGAWRLLPREFPVWQTVYDYFRQWRNAGVWEQIHTTLRERVRRQSGRAAEPSAAIIDSQSVKTTDRGGEHGYDGGKKINGRKRHLLVDTLGLALKLKVHAANVADREGARLLLAPLQGAFPRLRQLWVDMGYRGQVLDWIRTHLGWRVEVAKKPSRWGRYPIDVEPPPMSAFTVLPRRWVVERSFAWLGRYRRLSKDYEYLTASSEALIYAAMSRSLLRRLTQQCVRER